MTWKHFNKSGNNIVVKLLRLALEFNFYFELVSFASLWDRGFADVFSAIFFGDIFKEENFVYRVVYIT